MKERAMKRMTGWWVLLAVSLALVLGAANGTQGGGVRRPFIVLGHSAQSLIPHAPTTESFNAFVLLNQKTRHVGFTVSSGKPQLVWTVRGPAPPGEFGPEIASGSWTAGGNEFGPLTRRQVRALKRGQLYLEFTLPSAVPEPSVAMRGQILPIAGVRYPAP